MRGTAGTGSDCFFRLPFTALSPHMRNNH
jgi:hypothetical protein